LVRPLDRFRSFRCTLTVVDISVRKAATTSPLVLASGSAHEFKD